MKKVLNDSYLSVFCFEMAELLGSGILAGEGFLLLSEQEPDAAIKKQLSDIYDETFTGGRVCDAMERTGLFPEYMLRMIRVGEETGSLEKVFRSLSAYYDRQEKLKRTIRSAVAYPLLLFVIVLAVFFVFLTEVLPIFNNVFTQIGAEMTPIAVAFLNVGLWLSRAKWWILGVVVVIAVVAVLFFTVPSLRERLPKLLGRKINRKIETARLASALSLAVSGASDIDEAVNMAKDFVTGTEGEAQVDACRELLSSGKPFAEAAGSVGLFEPIYCRMLSIGERAGSTDEVMQTIAGRTEEDMNRAVDQLTGRIEPAAVIILSVLVGLLLLSVMLTLVGIMSAL